MSWSRTVFILSELTNNKEVRKSTHIFWMKSYHLSFDATKNAASLSTKKIHVELSSTKICQLNLPTAIPSLLAYGGEGNEKHKVRTLAAL